MVLSLYWLVPAAAALTTGAQIVEGSETLTGIARRRRDQQDGTTWDPRQPLLDGRG